MPIRFFAEDIKFKVPQPVKTKQWIRRVLGAEGYLTYEITYIFCSDDHLLHINQQFLKHYTYTDIITFDMGTLSERMVGEIYVSVDRIRENSQKFGVSFENELSRVMIHGILHLCGLNDKSEREKRRMRRKEDTYLSLLEF